MPNPKRYHIKEDGSIVECKKFLRGCPMTDYRSFEAAETALYLEKESIKRDKKLVTLNLLFKDPNTVRSTISVLMSGDKRGKTIRDYAHNLESIYSKTGQDPELYFAKFIFYQTNLIAEPNVEIYAQRFMLPNYETGDLMNSWVLIMEHKNSSIQTIELKLDFTEDSEQEMDKAYLFFEEAAKFNLMNIEATTLEKQANELFNQFSKAYGTVEEEIQGPNYVWEKYGQSEGLGNFKNSNRDELNADVEYGSSTLRPRSIQRFIEENSEYSLITPDINIRIWDNDNETSGEWWAARYYNGEWTLDMLHTNSNVIETISISDPEEARSLMYNFVRDHMRVNDDFTAREKSDFIANFMIQMVEVQKKTEEQSRNYKQRIADASRAAQELTNNDPSFQRKEADGRNSSFNKTLLNFKKFLKS